MKNLGYQLVSKIFLVKNFNSFEINITLRTNKIESIIGYRNNQVIQIPNEVLQLVKSDINRSL